METFKVYDFRLPRIYCGKKVKTPLTKVAFITSPAVDYYDNLLVAGFGVPYGCLLTSPVIFEYDLGEDIFKFRSFIAISEELGFELRETAITTIGATLIAFIASSFPVHAIYVSRSYDSGITWTEPEYTGINGRFPFVVSTGDRLILCVKNENKVVIWEGALDRELKPITIFNAPSIDSLGILNYMEDLVTSYIYRDKRVALENSI